MGKEPLVFVNAYAVERCYGGPEEGGWWYNRYDCLETYPTREKNAETVKEYLESEYENVAHGNIYSVLGGKELQVYVESKPAESATTETPRYE